MNFKTRVTEDFRLYIVNDPGMSDYWSNRGIDTIKNLQSGLIDVGNFRTSYRAVKYALADELKSFYEDELLGGVYSLRQELISSAIAWVDWDNLADNLISSSVEQICYNQGITSYVRPDEFINNPYELEEWIAE